MKTTRMLLAAATFLAAMLLTAVVAGATPAADTEPYGAPYIDQELHNAAPYSTQWYRFEFVVEQPGFLCHFLPCPARAAYTGNAVIRLNGLAQSGIAFDVYAPDQIGRWRESGPVGGGGEAGDDLVWAGEASSNGIWYVRVINNRSYPVAYRFAISGVRIALSRAPEPTATPWSVSAAIDAARRPTATPTPWHSTPATAGRNTSPDTAIMIDSRPQAIAPGVDLWYVAAFPMNSDPIAILLVDGASIGLAFEVYMPSQAGTWWKDDPVGRGSAVGDDLVWAGSPDQTDRRLLRVINRGGRAVSFSFTVQSTRPAAPAPLPFTSY